MSNTVDIRIMAHPSRADNVRLMLDSLGLSDEIVIWDDRPNGGDAMYTARKAWEYPAPEGCTHRLVLQDDGELCDGFTSIAEQVAVRHPDKVVTFMHEGSIESNERYKPFVFTVGVALMMPFKLIPRLWDFVDNRMQFYTGSTYDDVIKHDTTTIRLWMANNNIDCVTTVPSIVQHIGDVSLVGINRRRIATDYTQNPPLDGW